MQIITNNQWRNFLYGYELSESEKANFDWVDDIDSADFIRYRGRLYQLGQFMRAPESLEGWHGYHGDSFFSGVLIRVSSDGEQYQIATYIS